MSGIVLEDFLKLQAEEKEPTEGSDPKESLALPSKTTQASPVDHIAESLDRSLETGGQSSSPILAPFSNDEPEQDKP